MSCAQLVSHSGGVWCALRVLSQQMEELRCFLLNCSCAVMCGMLWDEEAMVMGRAAKSGNLGSTGSRQSCGWRDAEGRDSPVAGGSGSLES